MSVLVIIFLMFASLTALVVLWRNGVWVGRFFMAILTFFGVGITTAGIGFPFPIPYIFSIVAAAAVFQMRGR